MPIEGYIREVGTACLLDGMKYCPLDEFSLERRWFSESKK
jgi:hypothetical protein